MKQSILLVCLMVFLSSNVLRAQSADQMGTPEERADKITTEMTAKLPLDSSQVAPIAEINLKYAQRVQAEIIESDAGRYQKMTSLKAISNEKDEELKVLLNEDQWKNYEAYKKEAVQQLRKQQF